MPDAKPERSAAWPGQRRPLPYARRLDRRTADSIDLVVVHCTELPDLAMAREYGERIHHAASRTGNSGHYYLDRDGRIEEWVDPLRVAHHTRGYNERSIGVELVNRGRWPDWLHSARQAMTEPYPDAQIEALEKLLRALCDQFPCLRWLAGHEDLDRGTVPASDDPRRKVRRKLDPGPRFPWPRIRAAVPLRPLDA